MVFLLSVKQGMWKMGSADTAGPWRAFAFSKDCPDKTKKEIALTDKERREVGCRFLSGGFRAAIAHVKLIEQERDHE